MRKQGGYSDWADVSVRQQARWGDLYIDWREGYLLFRRANKNNNNKDGEILFVPRAVAMVTGNKTTNGIITTVRGRYL